MSTVSSDSISSDSDFDVKTVNMVDGDLSPINKRLLNIVSFNVNSITHGDRIEQLSSLCREINADIICLQETKLDDSISPTLYKLEGFNVETRHRNIHGGGVSVYIKEHIPYVRMSKLESKTLEHISIDIIVNHKKYSINNFYRPPNNLSEDKQKFLEDMKQCLTKLKSHRVKQTCLIGDFNFGSCYAANMNLNPLPLDNKAPDLFLEQGFYQQIDRPTRQARLSSSLIDLIFTDKIDNNVLTGLLPPISDHCGTILSLNTLSFKPQPKRFRQLQYDEANWKSIKAKFIELNNIDYNKGIDSVAEEFSNCIKGMIETHIPSKQVTILSKDKPWFNNKVKCKLRKSQREYKTYKDANNKHKTAAINDPSKGTLAKHAINRYDVYKKAKKDYEICARNEKRQFFHKLKQTLSNPAVSSKKKFQLLNRVTNTGKNSYIPPLIEGGLVVHKPEEKANLFNKQFAKKSNLEGYLDEAPTLEPLKVDGILDGILTSTYEVAPLIRALKTSEYSPCGIPSKFLQLSLERLGSLVSKPITKLLNTAFESGAFPKIFKVAHITPIWKNKGSMTDKANFRPISILPTLSKLAESVIHKRLIGHLVKNNLITDHQAAYLKGDSTTLQLLHLTHRIREAWANGKIAHAAFLDVSAAFDAVWHKGLLAKLSQAGIAGTTLNLLESYLTDRIARTVVEGSCSKDTQLIAGVPQGSRLGPILFILYVNDLVPQLNCIPHVFADDTTLLALGENTLETVNQLNRDLDVICEWSKKWKIKFNGDKSKDLIFTPKRENLNNSFPLIFNNEVLDRVGSHKHLGVTLEPDLTWNIHLQKVIQHANMKLSIIQKVKDLSRKTLDIMYKLHVRSIIDYCLPVYGPSLSKTQIAKLTKIQYRAARIAAQVPMFTSATKIFNDLGWETIENRISFLSVTLFHKIHTKATRPLTRSCMPPLNDFVTSTRSGKFYKKFPYHDATIRATLKDSFFEKISKEWDDLPIKTRQNWDIAEFKADLASILKPNKTKIFNYGPKFHNSIHTQLRVGMSQLNDHLFRVGISKTKGCLCGHKTESTQHFLLDCFLYQPERVELFRYLKNTRHVLNMPLSTYTRESLVDTLLNGEYNLERDRYPYNRLLFRAVQKFLVQTGRLRYRSILQLT